jgi:hypothetical protein
MSKANERALELISNFMPGQPGRKAAEVPTVLDQNGQALPRYLVEKINGQRRENGAMKLRRLTARHYRIIGMHLEGLSLERIARECLVTVSTASRIINDPLAQDIIKKVFSNREGEIQSLGGKALDAVRAGLDEGQTVGVRLKAVGAYTKMREAMLPKDKGSESAEDVIARILGNAKIIGTQNVQVNIGGSK